MFKKVLILIALIYFSVSNAFAETSVISSVDDTLKRTRGDSIRGFYNSVLSHKTFKGMGELFRRYKGDLYLVSEKYSFLSFNLDQLVEETNLSPKEIFVREPFKHESEIAYKAATIKQIIENSKDDFILIGNDKGSDQEVYSMLKKKFPNRIKNVYIHVVDNKKIHKGFTPYNTAFDIALREYLKNRLSKDDAMVVGKTIYKEDKFHKVFPNNSFCPTESDELKTKEELKKTKAKSLEALIGDISKKTLEYCNG